VSDFLIGAAEIYRLSTAPCDSLCPGHGCPEQLDSLSLAYSGRPIRRSKSWKRGSERRGVNLGPTLR